MRQSVYTRSLAIGLFAVFFMWIFCIISIFTGTWDIMGSILIIILLSIATSGLIIRLLRETNPYLKLLKILYSDCSPEAFTMEARTMLEKEKARKNPMKKDRLLICLGTGLYASGKYQEAFDVLVTQPLSGRENKNDYAGYCHILFLTCLQLGRFDMAKEALGKLKEASCRMKFGNTSRFFKQKYKEDMSLLDIAEGNYDGAENVFMDGFRSAESNYGRVTAAFILGKVYEHSEKNAERKDAYEYVVEHGNVLYIAKLAAEYLELS